MRITYRYEQMDSRAPKYGLQGMPIWSQHDGFGKASCRTLNPIGPNFIMKYHIWHWAYIALTI